MNLNVRDLPDEVHAALMRRANARGMSLRAYVVEVLTAHCALPTVEEWLSDLDRLPAAQDGRSGAAAVRAAREDRDADLARIATGR